MSVRSLLRLSLTLLLPVAVLSTVYIYLYPVAHACAFPIPAAPRSATPFYATGGEQHGAPTADGEVPTATAPFRLLVLADPQLEGDSSLPNPEDGLIPRLSRHLQDVTETNISWSGRRTLLSSALSVVFLRDLPDALQALRKRVDLFGNDLYLAHIYRALHWWTDPTHVTVLGDLIGSQWVTDGEFEQRGRRFWNRVFAGGRRVEDEITRGSEEAEQPTYMISDGLWENRIINIAGNHDIGYAGDITEERVTRFEKTFGRANWDVRFNYPQLENTSHHASPSLHIIVLNSLNLDTPALSEDLQHASYDFINSVISSHSNPVEDRSSFTLLLTHLPLHKPDGVCVDGPFFDFWDFEDADGRFRVGGLKEQNHLSDHGSRHGVLEGIFGMNYQEAAPGQGKGRNGLILTGHDHEGCDTWHYIPANAKMKEDAEGRPTEEANWKACEWQKANQDDSHAGIREITLRSMMGEFGGNAGLLSAWFDFDVGEWNYEIQMCKFGVQHIWWAVHVLDIVTMAVGLVWVIAKLLEKEGRRSKKAPLKSKTSVNGKSATQDTTSLKK